MVDDEDLVEEFEEEEDGDTIVVTKTIIRNGKVVKKIITRKSADDEDFLEEIECDDPNDSYYQGFFDHWWMSKLFGDGSC